MKRRKDEKAYLLLIDLCHYRGGSRYGGKPFDPALYDAVYTDSFILRGKV